MSFYKKIISEYLRQTRKPLTVLPGLPHVYQIEPINLCNLKCPTCSSLRLGNINKGEMGIIEFEKIVEQIPYGSDISLYNWGEPFLNKDIISIIKAGKERGLIINIHSNFNFEPELIPEIINSGLDHLSASIDGASQETYEKFRRQGNFKLAWNNFKEIAEMKAATNSPFPKLTWQFIVNKYNEHEIPKAQKMIANVPGDSQIVFTTMGLRQEKIDWDQYSDNEMEEMKREFLPRNKKYIMPYHLKASPNAVVAQTRCPWLWTTMVISVNGTVTPCCHTYKPEHAFGNINNSTLEEIWNNEAYVNSRNLFIAPSDVKCNTICSRCPNYIRIEKGNIITRHRYFVEWLKDKIFNKINR